jgi:histidinol dehydrogenase
VKRYEWANLDAAERRPALARPRRRRDPKVQETVRRIFDEVEAEGVAAVNRWSQHLDGGPLECLQIDNAAIARAGAAVAPQDVAALELATANIRRHHLADIPSDRTGAEANGLQCRRVWRPLRNAGLYIPGGTAPLFSTLLMLAIPADCAGVRERIAVTPPSTNGLHPMMILAAAASGLERIWLIGGAQAIAALTFGVGVPRADKIFGPGNAYVAEAKRYAAQLPGCPAIDLPAGPSELLVIADETADPAMIAADLLSQAEHDADAQVLLVSLSAALADSVEAEIERQLSQLPRRTIARAALEEARTIIVRSRAEAAEVSNLYAPEHLSLQLRDADVLVADITCAGTIFVGAWSAETFGDYVAGPSHVLPTDGAARACSGISVSSFMTSFVVQQVSREAAAAMAPAAARLARLEGLEAHARAAEIRAVV